VRVAAGLHGLYYLSGLAIPLALAFICLLLVTGQHSTVQHVSAALPLILVAFVLMSCDFYRQRFFIRPHREIGIHWRAAVLRFAKWPWLFLALIDVAHPRHRSYEITMKSALSGKRPAAAPHLLTALGIAGAWLIGWLVGRHPSPLIEVAAAFLIALSLATAATSFRSYPPPYDAALVPPSPA
jgi:hypothetical protein